MDCCTSHAGLRRLFGARVARDEANAYRKGGAPKRIRGLLAFLRAQGLSGATVLDIGFGVGALHFELLRAGASRVTGVEVSPAYVDAARALARELGFAGLVDYQVGDYAQLSAAIAPADVVALDRAVCCYPDWAALVGPSARSARRWYVLVLPAPTWYLRAGARALNLALRLIRHEFRMYMHPAPVIEARIAAEGLNRAYRARSMIWETTVYARAP